MAIFIFCLIFIQVSVFLIAGIVIVSAFYANLRKPADEPAEAPEAGPARARGGFCPGGALLTRSELNYLLGA